jgi:hypothetical protein
MFKQSFIGFINISLPVILFFYIFPALLFNPGAYLIVSICMGVYIWYLNYAQHIALQKALFYAACGKHKEMFDFYIKSCNLDPSKIILKYAYTAQQVAMAIGNTVVMDPTTCSICADDVNAVPVINVFQQLYEPTLNELGKKRQAWQSQNLTPEIQSFIFKHELGHVVDQYSYKKLWVVFLIGTLAVYGAINSAKMAVPVVGLLGAVFVGLVVGPCIDVFLTLFLNLVFKVAAEKRADAFAVKYSSSEEIIQAADFFAQEQEIIETYKDSNDWLLKLPTEVYSGHPNGRNRKKYLLQLAKNKENIYKS